jgi:hypothetical protein
MVGVGSGSALNAFNIGQAGTGKTAVGQAIEQIVAQRGKIEGIQAQSEAQSAGSLATAKFKAEQDAAPVDQFTVNPINNELIKVGRVAGNANVNFPTLTSAGLDRARELQFKEEDKQDELKNRAGAEAAVPAIAGLAQFNASQPQAQGGLGGILDSIKGVFGGNQPSAAPAAPVAPPVVDAGTGVGEGVQQLKSPEFEGLDPNIFQTPEGKAIIDRIIQQKLQGGGQL